MSRSFESVRGNACVHRLDIGLYSHPKEFWGNGVRTHVNSKRKILSSPSEKNSPQRRIEPMALHPAGQGAQHTTNERFRPQLRSFTPVATLPDAWRYRVSARTGWPTVSRL